MGNSLKYIANSFLWSTIAKIFNAIVQFISVPILLVYFGRDDYGLVALVMAVNAYLQLLDLGINIGSIKYFSEWISSKNKELLNRVFRTSISFYGIIGLLNALILVVLAYKGLWMFSLLPSQEQIFKELLLVLAGFSIFSWATSIFNQLLIANEEMAYVQKTLTARSLLVLFITLLTIYFKLDIITYFLLYIIASSIFVIPFFSFKIRRSELIQNFKPAFYWKDFNIVMKYSVAILAMGVFQMSAVKLRPVILSIFSNEGPGIIADYRILETITLFVISIGGSLMSVLLPKTSRLWMNQDMEQIEEFVYAGTKYTSILAAMLCIPILLCGDEILEIYVGKEFVHLSIWLNLWIFSILIFIHNTPVASLVLATGKTKMLVYSSAIACILSLIINAYLSASLGVGSAIVGYLGYTIIQMSFYYLYFNRKVLNLNSFKIFKEFVSPTIIAILIAFLVWKIDITIESLFGQIIVKCALWLGMFIFALVVLRIIKFQELSKLMKSRKEI